MRSLTTNDIRAIGDTLVGILREGDPADPAALAELARAVVRMDEYTVQQLAVNLVLRLEAATR